MIPFLFINVNDKIFNSVVPKRLDWKFSHFNRMIGHACSFIHTFVLFLSLSLSILSICFVGLLFGRWCKKRCRPQFFRTRDDSPQISVIRFDFNGWHKYECDGKNKTELSFSSLLFITDKIKDMHPLHLQYKNQSNLWFSKK